VNLVRFAEIVFSPRAGPRCPHRQSVQGRCREAPSTNACPCNAGAI
jgi:hypothetical protein